MEVKLRETENPWKPAWLRDSSVDQDKTADLYEKVRGVLNKLAPQKLPTLLRQVRALPIDTSERLQGVVDLVFEKAVSEPMYSAVYARVCKVLSNVQVADSSEEGQPTNFRKLLLTRCQHEFEKNLGSNTKHDERLKEIEQSTDPEKKKALQLEYEEMKRQLRMKSVGNIRFVGELFRLGMITSSIMHRCIQHLLKVRDEVSLQCLCLLLTTVGKALESKKHDLSNYFEEMKVLSKQRGQISFHVRFMLQDVIELRDNEWVPRQDDSTSETFSRVECKAELVDCKAEQVECEAERKSVMEMETPPGGGGGSRDVDGQFEEWGGDRTNGGGCPHEARLWTLQEKYLYPASSKLRITMCDAVNVSLNGSKQSAFWTRGAGGNSDTDKSATLQDVEDEKSGVGMYSQPNVMQPPPSNAKHQKSVNTQHNFGYAKNEGCHTQVVRSRTPSESSHKGSLERQMQAQSPLQSHDDSAADVLLSASTSSAASNDNTSHLNLDAVSRDIQFILEEFANNNIFQKLELAEVPAVKVAPLTPEVIHAKLLYMLRPQQGMPATVREVTDWISANVGVQAKTPEFVRILTTAVCESLYQDPKKFAEASFAKNALLLYKYVEGDEDLQLHCLYAAQLLNFHLEWPRGLLCSFFKALWDFACVGKEAFLRWEQTTDMVFLQGKYSALKSVEAFFVTLRQADSDLSEE